MFVQTLADIAGDNAKHQISSSVIKARWVKFGAVGGPARIGDTNTGSARGVSVPTAGQLELPVDGAEINQFYDLSQLYAYVPTGTTLTISYSGVG